MSRGLLWRAIQYSVAVGVEGRERAAACAVLGKLDCALVKRRWAMKELFNCCGVKGAAACWKCLLWSRTARHLALHSRLLEA